MKILLFGGAGYIGTHVALAFQERGDTVGIYDNFSSGLRENLLEGSIVYEGDILDRTRLQEVLAQKWDAVVHLAAFKAAGESMTRPEKYAQNNITGSLNLITECVAAGVKNFVLSSSAAVYGEPVYLPIDEQHPTNPENYYGYTKLAIERHLQWFDTLKGLKFAALRYFNAAGYDPEGKMTGLEHSPANLIPVVMEAAVGKREALKIFGDDYDTEDGTGVRDYVHVTDLADAHVRAVDYLVKNQKSLTVNLGSESGLSVLEILEASRKISGQKIPAEFTGRRPGDPAKLVATSKMANSLLGWYPKYSSLDSIIASTWNVYHRHFPGH
ncbi:MAG: UDP-glucose 4-epimerase GalE [Spirochaetia bacterium]|nr:UDP-glucose 4-epimerase GalE [Spirochaetia bacterium]MCF7940401.1 UDP-glucose 4-epimerase GalE [Spirochaetia bacterium]